MQDSKSRHPVYKRRPKFAWATQSGYAQNAHRPINAVAAGVDALLIAAPNSGAYVAHRRAYNTHRPDIITIRLPVRKYRLRR